jgi:hypothetical protein
MHCEKSWSDITLLVGPLDLLEDMKTQIKALCGMDIPDKEEELVIAGLAAGEGFRCEVLRCNDSTQEESWRGFFESYKREMNEQCAKHECLNRIGVEKQESPWLKHGTCLVVFSPPWGVTNTVAPNQSDNRGHDVALQKDQVRLLCSFTRLISRLIT